jgi:hypothetical protein
MPSTRFTPAQRRLAGSYGGHKGWGQTKDRTARTAKQRAAFEARFLREAEGDPKRAESLRKAYYAQLSLKGVQARQRKACGNGHAGG